MIVSIRGTNGSGKSYLITSLMRKYEATPLQEDEKGRPLNYRMSLTPGKSTYLVGSYETACGGCDGIQPYSEIWPRVDYLASRGGHVLLEGSLVSSGHGSLGEAMDEKYGKDVVYAFLDTPPETCITNVIARRNARGSRKEFDAHNLLQKYRAVYLSVLRIRDKLRKQVVMLDHRKSLQDLELLLTRGYVPGSGDRGLPDLSPELKEVVKEGTRRRKNKVAK